MNSSARRCSRRSRKMNRSTRWISTSTILLDENATPSVISEKTRYADFAYLVFSLITLGVAFSSSKMVDVLIHLVDRFIFRDRREQRRALEFIAGYILDAETVDDVYRALLQDAAHALKLSFGGILARQPDGGYELAQSCNWPEDF